MGLEHPKPRGGKGCWVGSSLGESVGELELYLAEQLVVFLQDLARGQVYQGQVYISHNSLRGGYEMQRLLGE